jgi:hypothetical protein
MNVTAPSDLQGRLIHAEQRARMIAESLQVFGQASRDLGPPSADALWAFGATAEEIADELRAINDAYGAEDSGGAR